MIEALNGKHKTLFDKTLQHMQKFTSISPLYIRDFADAVTGIPDDKIDELLSMDDEFFEDFVLILIDNISNQQKFKIDYLKA